MGGRRRDSTARLYGCRPTNIGLMIALWIVLGVLVLVGAFFVLRMLHRLTMAARQLQRTVNTMKQHVETQVKELDVDVKALGETIEETGRN